MSPSDSESFKGLNQFWDGLVLSHLVGQVLRYLRFRVFLWPTIARVLPLVCVDPPRRVPFHQSPDGAAACESHLVRRSRQANTPEKPVQRVFELIVRILACGYHAQLLVDYTGAHPLGVKITGIGPGRAGYTPLCRIDSFYGRLLLVQEQACCGCPIHSVAWDVNVCDVGIVLIEAIAQASVTLDELPAEYGLGASTFKNLDDNGPSNPPWKAK